MITGIKICSKTTAKIDLWGSFTVVNYAYYYTIHLLHASQKEH